MDNGDTAWMLFSTALVMLAVLGIGLFYGGMARKKNVLATTMHSFIALCIVSLIWVLWGYSLAFGPDRGGVIGGLEWFGLDGVGEKPFSRAPTIPPLLFMIYHGMLAAVAPALISSAFAERMKFSAFLLFTSFWITFVYVPLAHAVWGAGFIGAGLGALDFAGGFVVCLSAGVAGFASARAIGARRGYGVDPYPPHNRSLAVLGAALLWFGWLGLTAGSAFSAGGLAVQAVTTTVVSAGSAALGWCFLEWIHRRRPTVLGAVTGSVAGLAAITPAAGFVAMGPALIVGVGAGLLCYAAIQLMPRLGLDDSFDVFALFGIGGMWGILATGLFASIAVNPAGLDGVFAGNPPLLGIQALALIVVSLFVYSYTWIILKIVDWTVGLRVDEEEELEGLDHAQHGESGYAL
ncbi:MAG: ammonium transporter [Nitrospirae bacterium]|nr:ammonium transporter [Nitrospirota bacterium]